MNNWNDAFYALMDENFMFCVNVCGFFFIFTEKYSMLRIIFFLFKTQICNKCVSKWQTVTENEELMWKKSKRTLTWIHWLNVFFVPIDENENTPTYLVMLDIYFYYFKKSLVWITMILNEGERWREQMIKRSLWSWYSLVSVTKSEMSVEKSFLRSYTRLLSVYLFFNLSAVL